MKKTGLIFAVLSFLFFSCSTAGENGYIFLRVKFSDRPNFNIKMIPPETERIDIEVSGISMSIPKTYTLDRNSNRIVVTVPGGDKEVTAKAFDLNNKLLASAAGKVNVIPKVNNQLVLELEPEADYVSSTPGTTPVPSKNPCVVHIDPADIPLPANIEKAIISAGCSIVFPSPATNITPSPTSTPDTNNLTPETSPTPSQTSSSAQPPSFDPVGSDVKVNVEIEPRKIEVK